MTQQDSQTSTPEANSRYAVNWFRAILPVALIALCAELGTAILNNSTLPVYFTKALRIPTSVFTLLMIPFFISEALFKSPLGVLADRYGRKPLMLCGASVTIFTPFILMSIHYNGMAPTAVATLVAFGGLRLMDGFGGASLWPALFAYVGDVVEEKKRGGAMGLLNVTYMIGLALGFLAGGFVDDNFGPVFTGESTMRRQVHRLGQHMRSAAHTLNDRMHHHHAMLPAPGSDVASNIDPLAYTLSQPGHYYPSFILASCLFALAVIVGTIGLRGKSKVSIAQHQEEEKITWESFKAALHTIPQFLLLAFVAFYGMGCIAPLVKIFAMDEFHLSEKEVGILALWPILIIAAIAYPLGHLSDYWGKTRCVRLGFILCSVGLWGMPLLHHLHIGPIGFILSAAVNGLGFVIAFPAWNALLVSICDESKRGTVYGAVATAQGVGVLLGYLTGGQLDTRVSHIAPFVAAASLVSVASTLALLFIGERQMKPSPPDGSK